MLPSAHPGSAPDRPAAATAAAVTLPIRRWPERRAVVLGVAAVLFAALTALRLATSGTQSGIGLLLVVPTAMVALELGLAAGLVTAALSGGVLVAWSTAGGAGLGLTGLATRDVVFLAMGALAGRFSDRMRETGERQRRLMESGLALARLGNGDELSTTVARRARELVEARGVRVELLDGCAGDGDASGARQVRIPIAVRGERLGELVVEPGRTLTPEDVAGLEALAFQASIAADNQRLLEAARKRAALEAQLVEARDRLSARTEQLREVLGGQEGERQALALRLHEDAAQAMAAILLGLGALERDPGAGPVLPQLESLRAHVDATLADLRGLAVSLRPPVLDLGLEAALRSLGNDYRTRGLEHIEVAVEGAQDGMSRGTEAAVYRVVEEALGAYDPPRRAAVVAEDGELVVTVEGDAGDDARRDRVARIGARVDLLGGSLHVDGHLRARIPLGAGR